MPKTPFVDWMAPDCAASGSASRCPAASPVPVAAAEVEEAAAIEEVPEEAATAVAVALDPGVVIVEAADADDLRPTDPCLEADPALSLHAGEGDRGRDRGPSKSLPVCKEKN